jgi:hypothetical protein
VQCFEYIKSHHAWNVCGLLLTRGALTCLVVSPRSPDDRGSFTSANFIQAQENL